LFIAAPETGIMADDEEEKLPTSQELATSEGDDENKEETEPETVIVHYDSGITVYQRLPDGSLDAGRDFGDWELIDEDDAFSNEGSHRIKTVDIDTLIAIKDIIDSDNKPLSNKAGLPRYSEEGVLHFSHSDLGNFVSHRKKGLATKSLDWIDRASRDLWDSTEGEVSQRTLTRLRESTLARYSSPISHSKVLSFVVSFLKFLAKTKMEPRYASFEPYLEMPRAVKQRKPVTSRIVTKEDIENVLLHIKRAKDEGNISAERAAQYEAFVTFGAFTGQRALATISKLTVGQFRQALREEKPVLLVDSSQDKIRMEHYVPLHLEVVSAVRAAISDRRDDELTFAYNSFQMWIKRQKIPMSRFNGHFVLGDLRKFTEQHGDVIGWDHSNRAYILIHGVSGML